MRFNFRKISAIAVSALMTGMTLGVAAAANYPAPFVTGGVANAAIVYGTGAGVSNLDQIQAGNIQLSLGTFVSGGTVSVEGGEALKLEKSSNNFNFNDTLRAVYSDIDGEDMDFLADGTYNDGDVDEDYTQTITLGTKTLGLFADTDYNDKEPTLGFRWTNTQNILNYELEMDNGVSFQDLKDTDMPIMGKEYYVLDVPIANTSITLLDSAEKVILSEGETKTVGDKTVTIEYIDANEVKFNVNGEITTKLSDHEYEELDDGSYIVANEVMYASKEAGVSKVEFSIGKGKITLTTGEDVEVNEEAVDGLGVTIGGQGTAEFTGLTFAWNSDDETYLTQEDAITMPVFETIKLVFNGMTFPEDPEVVSLENGETMTLKMDNYELPLFTWAGTNGVTSTLGDEDYALVTAESNIPGGNGTLFVNGTVMGWAGYSGVVTANRTTNLTGGLDLMEDNRFIVTTVDTDLADIQTMYYEVTNIDVTSSTDFLIELRDLIGSKDLTFDSLSDNPDVGDLSVTLLQANDTNAYFTFTGKSILYNRAVSEKGLVATFPALKSTGTVDLTGGNFVNFTEANKDDDIGNGAKFTASVKDTTNDKLHVSATNVTLLEGASDVYEGYVVSDLASKITHDQTADEYDFTIDYYGAEVTADVEVVGGISTVSSGSNVLGNILVKDSEVSSVATKNLIVVGGSCINSAAAALVGGAKCGAAWTTATGIGTGQFLIKGYATSTLTSGVALLVAGYDAEDTVKATTYLTNKVVDTSKAYKGTTTTETAVVIN